VNHFVESGNNPICMLIIDYDYRRHTIPNFPKVTEIDVYGRRTTSPCFNHPDYRAHLSGKIESLLGGYASLVDGIAWGCERMGPFQNMIGGGWSTTGISCFCEHCGAKALARGVSVERAQQGYRQLDQLFRAAAKDQRPSTAISSPFGAFCWSTPKS
jgi:hypothetical protein